MGLKSEVARDFSIYSPSDLLTDVNPLSRTAPNPLFTAQVSVSGGKWYEEVYLYSWGTLVYLAD
jgi:hypothetical protein